MVQHPYNVKVDYNTPLLIEVTNIPPYSDKNYFRLVKSGNLLEIGLDATSYQLTNIILIQISNVSLVEKLSLKNVEMKQGCPVFLVSQGGIYQGGLEYEQIFIETPWKIEGVEVISSKPLN